MFLGTGQCLAEPELFALMAGEVTDTERERLDRHLDGCSQCLETVGRLFLERQNPVESMSPNLPIELQERLSSDAHTAWYRGYDMELGRAVDVLVLESKSQLETFEEELACAAQLEHNAIAVLLRSGFLHDGRRAAAFLAGEPVQWSALAQPSKPARSKLEPIAAVSQVCNGVAHAHAQGVVHGSIRSTPIKAIADTNQLIIYGFGSAWRSCRNRATKAADVHAIGLLLRTVARDLDATREVRSIIDACENEPPLYPSAVELADDLNKLLLGEPLSVVAPTFVERLRRWCQRHKLAAVAIGCTALLLVAGGSFTLWTINRQAQQSRQSGEQRLQLIKDLRTIIETKLADRPKLQQEILRELAKTQLP